MRRKGREGRKPRILRKCGPFRRWREAAETGGNRRKLAETPCRNSARETVRSFAVSAKGCTPSTPVKMGSGNCGKCGNWKEHSFWWLVQKKTQYVVDRFLRYLPAPGHERVVRRRPGIANDINEQCTAACLTSNGSGHISAPPRWGAGSRRKPRRSLTTRTATSQAILAAEFFSRGRCALAAMPVHSLCADARHGWTRDGDKETGSRCRPLTS
jgi:hypothetical protein